MTLLLFVLACTPETEIPAACDYEGTAYENGESWACSDGCNTCSCDDGAVFATEMGCLSTCTTDEGDVYNEGDQWTCADGCNTCSCEPGGDISSTDLDCSDSG